MRFLFLFFCCFSLYAGCDTTVFRWGCNMNAQVKARKSQDALIYCGSTRLYISKNQFYMLKRYQRAGIHMSLLINDIYYDGPCIPARYNNDLRKPTKV